MKEIFVPDKIFVFGGFALRANSVGHLEQIDSYAPGHQISFGNLNYVADVRGDLIFQGLMTPTLLGNVAENKKIPTVSPRSIYEFI